MWQPQTSIVIPTRSRPTQLGKCLAAIETLDYAASRFEVMVVDDGSEESLKHVINRFKKTLNITLVRQTQRGPAAARNVGASCSSGEVLAFTDDDCVPDSGWLRTLVAGTENHPSSIIGGRIENSLKFNRFSEASQILIDYLYAYYARKNSQMRFFASNNMSCRAEDFTAIGGFCEDFTSAAAEDRDFCSRWILAGNKLVYASEAVVFHAHELSPLAFWRQHFRYGRGAYKFHRLRTESHRGSLTVEPLGFYANMVLSPYSRNLQHPLALASLLTLSQIANAAGFFAELSKQGFAPIHRAEAKVAPHSVASWRPQIGPDRDLVLSDHP